VSSIRRLRPRDASRLGQIESAAWRIAYRGILPERHLSAMTPQAQARRWEERLRSRDGAVQLGLVDAGRLRAYLVGGPCRDIDLDGGFAGEIYELYVAPDQQGRGHGRALLGAGFDALTARGHRWGSLWVLERNIASHGFYEHVGLTLDSRRRRFWHGGADLPARRYVCPLDPFDPFALDGAAAGSGDQR